MAWRIAYSHDKDGISTGGDIHDLIHAIGHGASTKIIVHVVDQSGHPRYRLSEFPVRVWVHQLRVFASTLQYHFNFNEKETTWTYRHPPVVSIWGTDGKELVFTGQRQGDSPQFVHAFAMDWCVD